MCDLKTTEVHTKTYTKQDSDKHLVACSVCGKIGYTEDHSYNILKCVCGAETNVIFDGNGFAPGFSITAGPYHTATVTGSNGAKQLVVSPKSGYANSTSKVKAAGFYLNQALNLANFSYTKVIVTVTAYTIYSATGNRSDYKSPDFCLDATNRDTKDYILYDNWTVNQVGWKNYVVKLTQTYTYNGNWPHMGFNMPYAGNAVTISKIELA